MATTKSKATANGRSIAQRLAEKASENFEHSIALRLAPSMLQKLDQLADKNGVDRSTVIRTLLESALEHV
jgi:metal-responsive CopG/Arc/MetJ family transcriptional regulator